MFEDSTEQLVTLLQSEDICTRYKAAFELIKGKHSEGIDVIVEYLSEPSFRCLDCYEVVDQLAEIQDERVTAALIGMLDRVGHVVGNALRSLLIIGSERGIQAVFDMLMTPSPWYGWGTAQLIADHGERFLPRLLETSHHQHPLMRARSIHALGAIAETHADCTSAVEALIEALADGEQKVRERAAWWLGRLPSNTAASNALLKALDDHDTEVKQRAAEGLHKAGFEVDRSLKILVDSLTHDDWSIQFNAVHALRRIRDSRSVPALIHSLHHADHRGIRANSANALAVLNDQRAVEPLKVSLGDEDELVRANCVKALAQLCGTEVMSLFIELLFDTDMAVQQAVLEVWEQHHFHPNGN